MFIIRTEKEYEDTKKNIKKGIEIMRIRRKNNVPIEATFLNKITSSHIKEFIQAMRIYRE